MAYLAYYRPFKDPNMNKIEIFNEICVIITGYQLITFTDFVKDEAVKSSIGYWMIGTVIFNFGANILLQVIYGAKLAYLMIRRRCRTSNKKVKKGINRKRQVTKAPQS